MFGAGARRSPEKKIIIEKYIENILQSTRISFVVKGLYKL